MMEAHTYYLHHQVEQRITQYQNEARQAELVQLAKNRRKHGLVPVWTARQKLGLLLLRWGYALYREQPSADHSI